MESLNVTDRLASELSAIKRSDVITLEHIKKTFTPEYLDQFVVFDFKNDVYVYFDSKTMTAHLAFTDSRLLERATLASTDVHVLPLIFDRVLVQAFTTRLAGQDYDSILNALHKAAQELCLCKCVDTTVMLEDGQYTNIVLRVHNSTCYYFDDNGVWTTCTLDTVLENDLKVWSDVCGVDEDTGEYSLGRGKVIVPFELVWSPERDYTDWREFYVFKRLRRGSSFVDYMAFRCGKIAWAKPNFDNHLRWIIAGYNDWAIHSIIGNMSEIEIYTKEDMLTKGSVERVKLEVYLTKALGDKTYEFIRNNLRLVHREVYKFLRASHELRNFNVKLEALKMESVRRDGRTMYYEFVVR